MPKYMSSEVIVFCIFFLDLTQKSRLCQGQQLQWTPIYPSTKGQIDMWTEKETGCQCPNVPFWDDKCACCSSKAACSCGTLSPSRCTQCGFQNFCGQMCNMTIDSRMVLKYSGQLHGTINTPIFLKSPTYCWYRFSTEMERRIEIQIYKVYKLGKFKDDRCVGGFLQMENTWNLDLKTDDEVDASEGRICAKDEHFFPPIVSFKEGQRAILKFFVSNPSNGTNFVAFFNFPLINDKKVGFRQKGGNQIPFTDCDWVFHDHDCTDHQSCLMASPGYPGIYSANKRCRYLLTSSVPNVNIKFGFLSLSLPQKFCASNYLRFYAGRTTSSPVLATICGSNTKEQPLVKTSVSSLLVEFNTGALVPPFYFNGFYAYIQFSKATVEEFSRLVDKSLFQSDKGEGREQQMLPEKIRNSSCDWKFSASRRRSGYFDTSRLTWYARNEVCKINFVGDPDDIVEVVLLNYNIRGDYCQQFIEILNDYADNSGKTVTTRVKRICGPIVKRSRLYDGNFAPRQDFMSQGAKMAVKFSLSSEVKNNGIQAIYRFHNGLKKGRRIRGTMCDVVVPGASYITNGSISNPEWDDLFYWNIDGPMSCSYVFNPTNDKLLVLKIGKIFGVEEADGNDEEHCKTICNNNGCSCRTNSLISIDMVDHLLFLPVDSDTYAFCFCGRRTSQFNEYLLTINTPGKLKYNVAHFSWNQAGHINFTASYFISDVSACKNVARINGGLIVVDLLKIVSKMRSSLKWSWSHVECDWTIDILRFSAKKKLYVSLLSSEDLCEKVTNRLKVIEKRWLVNSISICPGTINRVLDVVPSSNIVTSRILLTGPFLADFYGELIISDKPIDEQFVTNINSSTSASSGAKTVLSCTAMTTMVLIKLSMQIITSL